MSGNLPTATEARQYPDQEPFPVQKAELMALPQSVSQLGFWSALTVLLGGILYLIVTVGNIILGFSYPPVELIQTLAGISTLLMAPGLIVLLACIHSYAPPEKKVLSQLGYTFGVVFAVLACMNRFLQFTVLEHMSGNGQTNGLTLFVIYHTPSVALALEMLSWGFCLGLATLFTAPVFWGGKLERVIGGLFIATGLLCVASGIGYVLANQIGTMSMVFGAVGMGLGVLAWSIVLPLATALLAVLFKRLGHRSQSSPHRVKMSSLQR